MRPPLWKTLLSYLHEIHIESAPSYINPHLYVSLSRGRYQLSTAHAIYSYGDLYANFLRAFRRLRWDALPGDEVLILGLGLGSIPYMLGHTFHKRFRYTAVELDEQVIYLAGKYVFPSLKSPVTIHHGDAVQFIAQSETQWDLICLDLFIDDVIPPGAQTQAFLLQLKNRLTSGGVLMYNCLARTGDDIMHSRTFLHEQFLPVFPGGGYLDVHGNWILINDMRAVI